MKNATPSAVPIKPAVSHEEPSGLIWTAVALAARGNSVGIIDADVYGFSIPRMLGTDRDPTIIDQMILPTPGIIAFLSEYYTLEPGDIIMTGTPAGIGPAQPGDVIEAGIGDLPVLKVRVVA